ncbi:hypothetical protein RND81_12G212800 [Saponaria officinalis]|uniref:ETFB lysine methyltransferase n=1 Tax=Saponaria officinalis TaxID=3572 RepID=A0AAW1HDJ0_SAPOF
MRGGSLSNFIKHLTCTSCYQIPPPSLHLLRHRLPPLRRHCRPSYAFSSDSSATADSGIPLYHSVLIRCRKDIADPLSEALMCFGANSVSMDDHEDYEDSDEVSICSIFTGGEDVNSSISLAADSVGMDMPSFELLKYDPYDWIKRTQESFDPVEVTKGLWIVPEWKTAPDAQATNIILNPGLAFGTGEHATTKMCLQFLHQTVKGGEVFLDYGTGSGILSIAALKLGAALSVGVDIDPQAITAARQNADLNHIAPEVLKLHLVPSKDDSSFNYQKVADALRSEEAVSLATDDTFKDKDIYDIVIANILLKPLLDLAEAIVSPAKEGSTIGLSGILHEQVPSVVERYSQFLEDISITKMEDWALITGRKKRDSVAG